MPADNISQLNHIMDLASNTRPGYLQTLGNNQQPMRTEILGRRLGEDDAFNYDSGSK
jgi:hypothetical protein